MYGFISFVPTTGHYECVDELLRLGSSSNPIDVSGNTPLHYAARNESEKSVLSLISFGAILDAKNCHGDTSLHVSVSFESSIACTHALVYASAQISVEVKYLKI